nr:immunoglobulin heavy chain junction region [Macaca mulatta]
CARWGEDDDYVYYYTHW